MAIEWGKRLPCLIRGCQGPTRITMLPDDPYHIAVQHGEDGEAVTILPFPHPLTDEHIDILVGYLVIWVEEVHAYESGALT